MRITEVNTIPSVSTNFLSSFGKMLTLCVFLFMGTATVAQKNNVGKILSTEDYAFLEKMTKDVMVSARILPKQFISPEVGANNTGGVLIRPGGRNSYPSFWIRDYAMSLGSGFVKPEEQKHMLLITATTQADQTWITKHGSMVPFGAIADHVRIDNGLPIYFPGTYDYDQQGDKIFGMFPPYCDQFYFVHMAYQYQKTTNNITIFDSVVNGMRLIDRVEIAFKVPPTRNGKQVVYTTENLRGVDYGFRDVIEFTGDILMSSILKYKAALELAEIFQKIGQPVKADLYNTVARQLKKEIPAIFSNGKGMLLASTGKSSQPDVWSTALAVYYGILEGDEMKRSCQLLRDAYINGSLSKNGNIRHVLISDDFDANTSWEKSLARKNTYQNGAYWGTPLGWVCFAISKVDMNAAKKLAKEYIDDLRKEDFRKGSAFGAPWECYNDDKPQNPVYMTTVASPYIVFKN